MPAGPDAAEPQGGLRSGASRSVSTPHALPGDTQLQALDLSGQPENTCPALGPEPTLSLSLSPSLSLCPRGSALFKASVFTRIIKSVVKDVDFFVAFFGCEMNLITHFLNTLKETK